VRLHQGLCGHAAIADNREDVRALMTLVDEGRG